MKQVEEVEEILLLRTQCLLDGVVIVHRLHTHLVCQH